jgi:hypothetical protein
MLRFQADIIYFDNIHRSVDVDGRSYYMLFLLCQVHNKKLLFVSLSNEEANIRAVTNEYSIEM